ncbi:MAG: winged helix-turn-helix domain-containing protein [Brevinema sp.]
MLFNALLINISEQHNVIKNTASLYHFHTISTFFVKEEITKELYHLICVSQHQKNYREIIHDLKFQYPYSSFALLIDDKEQINLDDFRDDFLIFILDKNNLEMSAHQFWSWCFHIVSSRYKISTEGVKIGKGRLFLDRSTFEQDGQIYLLSEKQKEMMKMLIKKRGSIVSRIALLENIWNTDKIMTDRVIDTNIVALRKIFGDDGRNPKYLETIFGQGYRLNCE